MTTPLETLYAELADIEEQMEDKTLPHSDQQLLDQAWDTITNQIVELEAAAAFADEVEWQDARAVLDPPLSILIPEEDGRRVCNCDGDGRCAYCEELEMWNAAEDDKRSCANCAGCMYCSEEHYDAAGEV